MKKSILLLCLTCLLCSLEISAQTKVTKVTATKNNDYGVIYFLPKTELTIHAKISKVTSQAGPYYKYAKKYLGIDDAIAENQMYYKLEEITVSSKGIPDKNQEYLIEFKSKTTAPFAYLTGDGLLCTINTEYQPEKVSIPQTNNTEKPQMAAHSVFTEEYLQAGSVGKMAEISAKQIYRLRESRMDMLTGEAEKAPRDGEAMKLILQQLEIQEKALVEQFKGTVTTEEQTFKTSLFPEGDIEKRVIFRFSKHLGIVPADDLSGVPVYINLKNQNKKPEITDPKELEKMAKEKANPKGVIYCVPGKASIEIISGTQTVHSGEILISQFGETQTLLPNIFEDKKAPVKILFYPETGALKQVIQ